MDRRHGALRRAALATLASALFTGPAVAVDTFVTGISGSASMHGRGLGTADRLTRQAAQDSGDVERDVEVVTDADSTVALLHGSQLLVELAPSSRVRIRDDVEGFGVVVEVLRGQARITTERTRSDPRVEVRTLSALIRPLTSTIHVEFNEASGGTLVTSLANRALVVSADVAQKRSALLNSNQWVSVPQGQAPGAIKQVDPDSAQKIADEAQLVGLRSTALVTFSEDEGDEILARIAAADVPGRAPLAVTRPFLLPTGFAFAQDDLERQEDLCLPTDCGAALAFEDPRPGPPPICIGLPGEQCQRP